MYFLDTHSNAYSNYIHILNAYHKFYLNLFRDHRDSKWFRRLA